MGHALAAQADLRVGLGARLDLDLLVTVDGRHRDSRAQRRLGDRDPGLVVQLGPVTLERGMRVDVDRDIEGARRAAAGTDLALVREPDLVAFVDAGGDRHAKAPLALRPAVALARLARGLDDLALATTARAGADVDHLAEHGLADAADLAAALALRAGRRLGARLGTAARAGLAAAEHAELDLLLRALDGFLERDPQVIAQVRPGLRAPAARRATASG